MAAGLYAAVKQDGKPFRPADYGFEFSIDDIESYLEGVRAANATGDVMKGGTKAYKSLGNAA
jgi:hypothetical protein